VAKGKAGETEGGVVLKDTQIIIYVRLPCFSLVRVILNQSSDLDDLYSTTHRI